MAIPPWGVMWLLSFAIYAGCKWLTWQWTPVRGAPPWRHAAYLLAWPGLDAAAFLLERPARQPSTREWVTAFIKLALGLLLFFGAARLVVSRNMYIAGWIGMIGLVLTLHFGIFHVLSCMWRAFDVDARPLMNRPLAAVSLSEFWGRRWNTAFRDFTHRFLFQPLTVRLGTRVALISGFLFSGIVHDAVISLPPRGGYGGPTAFFLLQAVGMIVERTPAGRRIGLGRSWTGWVFTLLVLLLPVYWLFHPPFVERVVVPFMRAVRAL